MSWVAVGGAAVSVVGGLLGSSASKSAANTQAQAAVTASQNQLTASNNANTLTADLYKQGLINQAPAQQGGQLALSALMSGFGLGPAQSAIQPQTSGTSPTPTHNATIGNTSQIGNGPAAAATNGINPGTGTTNATPSTVGTFTNSLGQPVDAQGNVITQGPDFGGIGNLNYGATQGQLNTAAGTVAPGSLDSSFTPADLAAGLDPAYQWDINQGQSQLAAKEASTGNRLGSQSLKDITDYTQNQASNEYGNAFSRFQTTRSNIVNGLTSLAGIGTGATNADTAAGTAAGAQIGANTIGAANASSNYLTGGAAATAAGTVGSTNAIVGGLNNGIGNIYTGQVLNKYLNQPSSGPTYNPTLGYSTGGGSLGFYNQGQQMGPQIPGDADGGRVTPQVGTYGPVRSGGGGGLSREAILQAVMRAASAPASSASGVKSGVGALKANPVTNPTAVTEQQLTDAEALALQPDAPASVPAQADGGAVGAPGPEMTSGTGQQQENEMVNGPQGFMSWLYHGMPKGNERNERAIYQMLNSYTPMPNKSVLAPAPTWAGAASAAPSPLTPAKSSTDYLPDDIYKRMSGYLPAPSASQAASAPSQKAGGRVNGRGGPRQDNLLRWLSNGEFVVNAKAAKKIGYDNLEKMNNKGLPKHKRK